MDETFSEQESLLRAVYPATRRPDFWNNGRLSSAALKDKRGLSVERTYDRTVKDATLSMSQRFQGLIISITVPACNAVQAYIKYCPSQNSPYHSEIHGSQTQVELSDTQAFLLARSATIQFVPNLEYYV